MSRSTSLAHLGAAGTPKSSSSPLLRVPPSDVASAQVETGSGQEKGTKSKISSMQLFGKSRSQGNVFARRGKDSAIEAASSPSSPCILSRSLGKFSSETSSSERVSSISSSAHVVVPVLPYKEVGLAQKKRQICGSLYWPLACVEFCSSHVPEILVAGYED